ncbi:outer membrane receptor protein involved in Fe transport [Nitrosospira sp. Nsp5]|uniref:Outer membrane receptor proteins, mostly Fe transport n=1 Tax=Nitrosospira multiformis TaxID=1231 RepID=A0ABY0TKI7_9PROT|nr:MULTISPECIES: TonB-dependent receptor plug domain-containing protein [Nitrosospira]PTR10090.1 outer membrane receptor protein involved in Fe transport [Nitrosospira sp. Nsp5]SDQ97653.1 Outer membrane receptor proteins, mostly Fe transport [Nitrosospira multiformis]
MGQEFILLRCMVATLFVSALPALAQQSQKINDVEKNAEKGLETPTQPSVPFQVAANDLKVVRLEPLVIKGQSLTISKNQPFSVHVFDKDFIADRQVANLEHLFRETAGMEVRSLGYGSVASSINLRGFAGGGHGGDIGFVIDGIPLNEASSHADGYADMSVVIPLEINAMRIFKGPVSALYGNFNRAGVVALETRRSGKYAELDVRGGSFGTVDLQAAAGGKFYGVDFNAAVQNFTTNGFRPQSDSNRQTGSLSAGYNFTDKTRFTIAGRAHTGEANTASVIAQDQYDNRHNRSAFFAKNPNVQNDGTDKDLYTIRGDLSHAITPQITAALFGYATTQTFRRSFTRLTNATTWQQRQEDYDRDVLGFGLNVNGKHNFLFKPLTWVLGAERYEEKTLYKYADALNNGQFTPTTLTAGVNGGSGTLNRNLKTNYISLFAQTEWVLNPYFRPSFGIRRDFIDGECDRRGLETRTGASAQCGKMENFDITTPKFGFRSTLWPGLLEARLSVADGFALPSDAAKFTPGIGVKPTTFRQLELGFTLTPGSMLIIDVAHYQIESKNEVALPNPALLDYVNVGKTKRIGTEAEIRFMPAQWFEATAAISNFNSRITETLPNQAYLLGADVVGMPKFMATFTGTVRPMPGMAITAIGRIFGRYPINLPTATAAQAYYDGYETVDIIASYEPRSQPWNMRGRYFVQVFNLTDARYASSAGITSGSRTYNPAAPLTVLGGISFKF